MRIRLALPLIAIAGALVATAPASATSLGAAGLVTKAAEVSGQVAEQVHWRRRHWNNRRYARNWRWRHRHYAYRPYYYRPYNYYPYYSSYYPYGYYPYYGRRRYGGVSVYLNF